MPRRPDYYVHRIIGGPNYLGSTVHNIIHFFFFKFYNLYEMSRETLPFQFFSGGQLPFFFSWRLRQEDYIDRMYRNIVCITAFIPLK